MYNTINSHYSNNRIHNSKLLNVDNITQKSADDKTPLLLTSSTHDSHKEEFPRINEITHLFHTRSVSNPIQIRYYLSTSEGSSFNSRYGNDAIVPIHPDDESTKRYEDPEEIERKLAQLKQQQWEEQQRLQEQQKFQEQQQWKELHRLAELQQLKKKQFLKYLKQISKF